MKPAAPPANPPANLSGPVIGPAMPAPLASANIGQGDIAPRLEAGFTTPGPDGVAQLFVTATLRPGLHMQLYNAAEYSDHDQNRRHS